MFLSSKKESQVKSWTAPGHDVIHTYCLKKLTALDEHLAAQINHLLMDGTQPDWFTQGWTVLIKKVSPSNYRPITFLITTWKLLSVIIADKMRRHMAPYMIGALRAELEVTPEAKHQLLIDRTVTQTVRSDTQICAAQVNTGMLKYLQHQQDTKSLHQELIGAVENNAIPS